MRRRIARVAMIVAGIVAGLGLAEGAVRAWVPVRNVGPVFSVYDAEDGKRLKRSARLVRRTPEFTMTLTTNRDGYRGPELPADPTGCVLALGDSFTMGYGVDDGEEYPARLRAALAAAPGGEAAAPTVVNAGIGNAGNGRWLTLLRRDGDRLAPRLVVLQLSGSDFADNVREGLFTLGGDGALVARPGPAPRHPLRRLQAAVEAIPGLSHSYLVCLGRQALDPGRPGGAVAPAADAAAGEGDPLASVAGGPLTVAIVDAVVALCAERGWPALALGVALDGEQRGVLERAFSAAGVPWLAIPGKAERPDLYHVVDGHWTPAGHAEVAARIQRTARWREAALGEPTSTPVDAAAGQGTLAGPAPPEDTHADERAVNLATGAGSIPTNRTETP